MYKIGICDDDEEIANYIERILLDLSSHEGIPLSVDVFFSGNDLEKEIHSGTIYDLLYLDIQMENGDGITAAQNIRKTDENVLFIFVSGYEKYVSDLFRLDVFGFIKKPIDLLKFTEMFTAAAEKISKNTFYFSFCRKNEELKFPCNKILYFESQGRKINFYTQDGKTLSFNGKLSDIEAELSKGKIPFFRIHQSYLVNYHFIRRRSKTEVTLSNGKTLPISENKQKEFNLQYSLLLGGEINV